MGTLSKALLICQNCLVQGTRSILGETVNEEFVVMRFHNGFTKIRAESYSVVCGNCDKPALTAGTYST